MQSLFSPCRIKEILLLIILCVLGVPDIHLASATLQSASCGCDLHGTIDPYACNSEIEQRCQCKEGHSGPSCSSCVEGFYRSSDVEVCKACRCNHHGSDSTCDKSGACSCLTGYTGKRCSDCAVGAYRPGDQTHTCLHCRCQDLERCLQLKDRQSDPVCSGCLKDVSWTVHRCNVCDTEHDAVIQDHQLKCTVHRRLDMEATLHKDATVTPPQKNPVPGGVHPATVYVTIMVLVLVMIFIVFMVVFILKKRRRLRHPANFPFWTVELRQEDNTSLAGANEPSNNGDVMYLDDAYLMDTPENFTTAVDTTHEDDRIGYHTLR